MQATPAPDAAAATLSTLATLTRVLTGSAGTNDSDAGAADSASDVPAGWAMEAMTTE